MLAHGPAEIHEMQHLLGVFMHGFECSLCIALVCLSVRQGITGAFRPGVLTALMGASGAGKTTLMDVLADRKTGFSISHVCLSDEIIVLCHHVVSAMC